MEDDYDDHNDDDDGDNINNYDEVYVDEDFKNNNIHIWL